MQAGVGLWILDVMPIFMIIALDIIMIIWSSINCPTIICLPTVCYFSREKPLVKPTTPGSLSHIICLCDLFSFAYIFRSIKQKIKKYLDVFYSYLFYLAFDLSIYYNLFPSVCLSWGAATRKGLTTPFTLRVVSSCYLCAGVVYVVLLGSSIGSITLV